MHNFLRKRHHTTHTLETLAIMYSLPYAFLTWGMVMFLLAFILMFSDIPTPMACSVIGLVTFSVCTLITWCVWMVWEEMNMQWRLLFGAKLTLAKDKDRIDDKEGKWDSPQYSVFLKRLSSSELV